MNEPTVVPMTYAQLERAISQACEPMPSAPPYDECCDSPGGAWLYVEEQLGGRWVPRPWLKDGNAALKLLAEMPGAYLDSPEDKKPWRCCIYANDATLIRVGATAPIAIARLRYERGTGQRVELVAEAEAGIEESEKLS